MSVTRIELTSRNPLPGEGPHRQYLVHIVDTVDGEDPEKKEYISQSSSYPIEANFAKRLAEGNSVDVIDTAVICGVSHE